MLLIERDRRRTEVSEAAPSVVISALWIAAADAESSSEIHLSAEDLTVGRRFSRRRVARSQPKQETRDDSKSGGEAQFVRKKFIFVKARSNHPLPLTPAGVKVSLSHLGSVCQDSRGNFRGKASANEE